MMKSKNHVKAEDNKTDQKLTFILSPCFAIETPNPNNWIAKYTYTGQTIIIR